MTWTDEAFYSSGDPYFDDMLAGIAAAHRSVRFETYIFEKGVLGDRMIRALTDAMHRGCEVTLMVDGIGAPDFRADYGDQLTAQALPFNIYHPAPWARFQARGRVSSTLLKSLQALNRRNHRKACVVDGQTAWLGGMNVSDLHLHSVKGADCWRDNGVRVRGPEVALLDQELEATFNGTRTRPRQFEQLQSLRLNSTFRSRRRFKRDLTRRMDEEQQRVWMMTPYFVPGGRLLRAIRRAARRGLDVRLVIPRRSDVPFIRWISWRFCEQLMRDGVRVYEYLPRVLHAKSILFGHAAITGSTNLNHRSDLHDLEVDVVLEEPATLDRVKTQFMTDFAEAEALTIDKLQRMPWLKRLAGRLLVVFRSLF